MTYVNILVKVLLALTLGALFLQFTSCHRYTKPSAAITAERKKIEKKSMKDARKQIRQRRRNQKRSGYYGG